MKSLIKFTRIALLAALATGVAGNATADDYPSEPIEFIVNYKAGGLTDAFARKLAQYLPKYLPNNPKIVVVNKPGGAGTIGLTKLANADADGYTIGLTTSSPLVIQPLYGKTPFTAEDFTPIAKTMEIPAAFNVHKDSDIQTLDQLVEFAQQNPGKVTFASTGGNGSGTHLVGEKLASIMDISIRHIPFEGTAQMTTALASKQVSGTVQMPTLHRGGDARPLVFLTSMKPQTDLYKDVPTSQELGIPAVADFFSGVVAPKGVPANRVKLLEEAFQKAIQEPEIQKWSEGVQIPVVFSDSEAFSKIIATEVADNREQMNALGLLK